MIVHFFLMFMTLINSKQNSNIIFEFNSDCAIESWQVVDDVVMGGKSFGQCILNEKVTVFLKAMFLLKTTEVFHQSV